MTSILALRCRDLPRQPFHFARQCSLKEPAEKPYPNYSHLPTFSNHGIAIDVIMRFTFVQDLSPSRIISRLNYGILRRPEFHGKRLRLELTNAFRHLRMERSQLFQMSTKVCHITLQLSAVGTKLLRSARRLPFKYPFDIRRKE